MLKIVFFIFFYFINIFKNLPFQMPLSLLTLSLISWWGQKNSCIWDALSPWQCNNNIHINESSSFQYIIAYLSFIFNTIIQRKWKKNAWRWSQDDNSYYILYRISHLTYLLINIIKKNCRRQSGSIQYSIICYYMHD